MWLMTCTLIRPDVSQVVHTPVHAFAHDFAKLKFSFDGLTRLQLTVFPAKISGTVSHAGTTMCFLGGRPHIRYCRLPLNQSICSSILTAVINGRLRSARVSSRGISLHTPQLLQMSLIPKELETTNHGMHGMRNQEDDVDLRLETGSTSRMSTGVSCVGSKATPLFLLRNGQKISLANPIERIYALTSPIFWKHIKVRTRNHQRLPAHASLNNVEISVKQDAVGTFNVLKRHQGPTGDISDPEIDEEGRQADGDMLDSYVWQAETDLTDFYARHST